MKFQEPCIKPTSPSRFEDAVKAYLDGRHGRAEKLFRQIIKKAPANADAFHLLGLIALQNGRFSEAERRIGKAIQINSTNPAYFSNLGLALRDLGRFSDAVAAFNQALALDPDYVTGLANLGVTLIDLTRHEAAEAIFRRLLAREPTSPDGQFGLANALLGQDKTEAAVEAYQQVLVAAPTHLEALSNLANAQRKLGDAQSAIALLKRAEHLAPDNADIAVQLGNALSDTHDFGAAAVAYQRALEAAPDHRAALLNLAGLARRKGDGDSAKEYCGRLLASNAEDADAHAELAMLHEDSHFLASAAAAAERAMALDPSNSRAIRVIARLARRGGDLEAAASRLTRYLEQHADQEAQIELGQILDRLDRPAAAFEAFLRANRALAAEAAAKRFDGSIYLAEIACLQAYFATAPVAAWPSAPADDGLPAPTFLVAFPRSGTTLMEQILDAHPAVTTTGEATLLTDVVHLIKTLRTGGRAYPDGLGDLEAEALRTLRQAYWQGAVAWYGETLSGRHLVDKLPLNLVHLGLVRRLFPDAKILLALRDPRDVVLSCFMQTFELNAAMVHFLDLRDAAQLYRAVMALGAVYQQRLGLDLLSYRYEDLVAAPETTARRVFAHLGLPWDDRVMRYYERRTGRAVATPSYQDVTQPVYGRAVGRWRSYRGEMAGSLDLLLPAITAFGYDLE